MFNSTQLIFAYCGNESNSIVWNNDLHTFGACFLFTVIEIPVYFLAIIALSYLIGNLRQPDELDRLIQKIEFALLFFEFSSITAYAVSIVIDKINYYSLYNRDYNGYINFAFKLITLCLLTCYTIRSLRYFNYSLTRLITLDLLLAGLIIVEILHLSWMKVNLIYCYVKLIAIFLYFVLFNFTHFVTKRHSLFYESFASDCSFNPDTAIDINSYRRGFISKLFFDWVKPFLLRAANDQVRNEADIFHLPENLTSDYVKKRIQNVYNELRRSEAPQQEPSTFENENSNEQDENVRQNISNAGEHQLTHFKLRTLLWKCYKDELYKVSFLKFVSDVSAFATPYLLHELINYIDSKDYSKKGFWLVFALLVASLTSSITINLYDFLINNICISVKSTVMNLVYRNLLLRTSTITLNNGFSNGQLVNFTSVDAERISNFFSSFFQLFSMPIQVIVALYLLYFQIGYSFIAGFLFSVLLLGINRFISFKIAKITGKLLNAKDERIKLTTKLITGIKAIKMCNYQNIYTQQIDDCRKKEVKMLKQKKYLDSVCVYLWATTPTIISFLTFCTYVMLGNKLTAANVFTSLALLSMMINPLNSVPWVLTGVLESWISMKRVQEFLDANTNGDILVAQQSIDQHTQEKQEQSVSESGNVLELEDIVCEHKTADGFKFILGPIDLKVRKGEFLGVIGQVGSGKSIFLNAILNEVPLKKEGYLKSGQIKLNCGSKGIGYLNQIPWIQNDTIRNNILFGKNYEYHLYNEVIDACELRKDFELFSDFDNTMISDRGLSLSGGQKTRLALARALYQSKEFDLYLIDDVFSSLDTHVACSIYENCIVKFLANKTRIVCTNQFEYLKDADRIMVLDNGCVKKVGTPREVLSELSKHTLSTKLSKNLDTELYAAANDPIDNEFKEEMNKGTVELSVYSHYVKAISISLSIAIVAFVFAMQSSRTSSDYWLSYWTERLKIDVETDSMYYLKILLIIVLVNSVLAAFRSFLFAFGCINAATNLYNQLYQTVLNSKLSFFNARPIGEILNLFSSDVFHIDENLPFTLNIFLSNVVAVIATIVITAYSVPLSMVILILLCFPYYKIQFLYRQGSMILKRFSTNTLSPLYSQFHETLLGLTTIRAYRASRRFIKHFEEKVDMQNSTNYSLKACTQWLNLRIQLIGIVLSCTIALCGCVFHYYSFVQKTSLIGLGMVYSLQITSVLNGLISSFTTLEIDFISVERLLQYLRNSEKEKPGMIKLVHFPKKGEIKFEKVTFKYQPDANYALNSISFKINAGSFVGIVGRTGAGKSSIFQCLFRMYDLLDGSIYIDDQNIRLLHFETLRKGMYILTQDPFLFDGSIRDNLDPNKTLTDLEIWQAVDECNAKAIILKLGGLNAMINDQESSNLSCGEKQLICIIRALLCEVKILCLDEATSSLDQTMETHICKTIKKAFAQSTILMISHRPSSVLNCDFVMVIEDGKLLEYATPDQLICDSNSTFSKM